MIHLEDRDNKSLQLIQALSSLITHSPTSMLHRSNPLHTLYHLPGVSLSSFVELCKIASRMGVFSGDLNGTEAVLESSV